MMLTSPRTEGAGQRQDELALRSVLKSFFFFQALESTTRISRKELKEAVASWDLYVQGKDKKFLQGVAD